MYPQQVIDSCHSAKDSSFYVIPADIAHFLRACSSQLPCFLLYTCSHREIMSSLNSRTSENVCCNHFGQARSTQNLDTELSEIWTLNYLETLAITHEICTFK